MKHALLASVAALALTAASTVAFSQGGNAGGAAGAGAGAGGGTSAPMANPSGSAGGSTGGAATGRTSGPSTTNPTGDPQSTINETTPPGAHKGAQDTHKGAQDTTGPQKQKSTQQAPAEKSRTQQSQGEQPRGERREQSQTEQRGSGGKQQSQTEQRGGGGTKQGTADRPMTSKNVSLTTEQKTTIREKVLTSSAPRVTNVNFDIKVGGVVPRTVRVAPLPATIVEIEPDWRGYMYFVSGDEIIVVEPGSLRIVAVLEV